jgi:hypothetical protein
MTVFWYVALCSLVETDRRFRGALASFRVMSHDSQVKYNYMKVTVTWNVALCSLIENDRRFRGAYCLRHQGDES